jgi:RNA polymerase sigma-70 factor (ECF subfamily)
MTNLKPDHLPVPRDGENQANAEFDRLFIEHYRDIFRLAYRIVGSGEEAQDLAQEVFLRLSQHQFARGVAHNVRAWLYRVATNLAFNSLRGRKRQQQRVDRIAEETPLARDSALDPANEAMRRETCQAVRRILAQLPDRDAQLLLLRHAGLSYQELANALDVAPGSVGTLIARAEASFTDRWSEQHCQDLSSTKGVPDEMRYGDTAAVP